MSNATASTSTELREKLAGFQKQAAQSQAEQEKLQRDIEAAIQQETDAELAAQKAARLASQTDSEKRLRELLPQLNRTSAELQALLDQMKPLVFETGASWPGWFDGFKFPLAYEHPDTGAIYLHQHLEYPNCDRHAEIQKAIATGNPAALS